MWSPKFNYDLFTNDPKRPFVYTPDELGRRIEYLCNSKDQPQVINAQVIDLIINLLDGTTNFLGATSLDPMFVNIRQKSKKDNQFDKNLSSVAKLIEDTNATFQNFSNSTTDSQFFSSALHYCLETIFRRVQQLKETRDKYYVQHWDHSALKEILEKYNYKVGSGLTY